MKKRNIYQNQSQELLQLFEEAGSSEKVMCVPMDYAKKDHLVMFCNGYGDILRKPFSVKNTPEGIAYINDQVTRSCRRRGINKNHVFFGGEDANSFAKNFVSTLRSKGFLVANVNAHDAKKQRGNLQASTDRIDLMGIATMLLNCRGNCCPAQSGTYRNLRLLVRHRRKLVQMLTAEIGNPNEQKPLNNLSSYAGIVPRVKQTGGIDGKTYTGPVAKRCNRILKDYVVKSAYYLGLHGPQDLMVDYKRRDASGQHADFGMGRRYLRMAMCLMRTSQVYLPPDLRKDDYTPEEKASYYLINWPYLREIWKKVGVLEEVFASNRPLGLWRLIVQELYDIKLKL